MADDRFQVPEPSPGIGSGLLTEVWRATDVLPSVGPIQRGIYFVQRAVQSLLALPMSNLITVMTIGVSLFLFSGFLLILKNIDRAISDAGSTLYVTVYLKTGAPEAAVNDFVRALEKDSSIKTAHYVSREEALRNFKRDLGPHSGFVEGLEKDNPLPASIDLTLQPDELGINNIGRVVERLRKQDVVDEVVYGSEWVEQVHAVIKVFRLFGAGTLIIVLAIIVFLISNTIKLVIYSRRDEIAVMQLVGATEYFIRVPFILGGVIQGLIGAAFSLLALKFCFFLLNFEIRNSTLLHVALPSFEFLGGLSVVGVVVLGIIVGAVGSFFALGRFLDV